MLHKSLFILNTGIYNEKFIFLKCYLKKDKILPLGPPSDGHPDSPTIIGRAFAPILSFKR